MSKTTPLPVFVQGNKKKGAENGNLAKQTLGATALILGMNTIFFGTPTYVQVLVVGVFFFKYHFCHFFSFTQGKRDGTHPMSLTESICVCMHAKF